MSEIRDEDSPSSFNGWKAASLVLIALLVSTCFVCLYFASSPNGVSAAPNFIEVSIEGSKKLGVNETGSYLAKIINEGNYEFVWSISPVDNKTLLVPNGAKCNLTFVTATEEPYLISIQVKNTDVGNLGSSSIIVYDPYTNPNLYLGSTIPKYNFIVESDGLGWYHTVNGSNGAFLYSSTNVSYVLEQTSIAASAIKGTVFLFNLGNIAASNIRLYSNTEWTGTLGTWFVLPASSANNLEVIYAQDAENITLDGINVDGNWQNNLAQTGSSNIKFLDCRHITVTNCQINGNRWFGLIFEQYASTGYDFTISNNVLANNQWNALTLSAGDKNLSQASVYGNTVYGTTGDIAFDTFAEPATTSYVTSVSFVANKVLYLNGYYGSGGAGVLGPLYGFRLEHAGYCTVANNVINGSAVGIYDDPYGLGHHTISGNVINIYDGGYNPQSGLAIVSNDNVLYGNQVRLDKSMTHNVRGIDVDGGDNNVVALNIFTDDGGSGYGTGYRDNGTNNTLSLNTFTGFDTVS